MVGLPLTRARTAQAVWGCEESPALSGARKSVKFGVEEDDSDGGGNDGSVVLAGGSV